MPSQPPETPFYNDAENVALWNDVVHLYQQFVGLDSEQWSEREERWFIVQNDMRTMLRELPRKVQV